MKKPYFQDDKITLYEGDSLRLLKEIPEESVDLIFADPPYFLSNDGITCSSGEMKKVNKGNWDKSNGFEKDLLFNEEWINECKRILKKNGSIWISGTRHNIFSIGFLLQKLEFELLNEIAWFKPNASPNLACRYFTHSHETLLWAKKNKRSKQTFNYQVIKNWKYKEDDFKKEGKQMRSVWQIPATPKSEKKCGKHPTQKPIELLKRIIASSSDKNYVVLDPFCGSGTTGVVCKMLSREFIGIDCEKEYLSLSKKRLKSML